MKKHIKLSILSTIILLWFTISVSFSAFQDNLYCELTKLSVRIYTKKTEDTIRCQQYIQSLEYLIKKEYQDTQRIDLYISKKQDVEYRSGVRASKIQKINDLQKIRIWIIESINVFESNFIQKSQEYLQKSLYQYQRSLEIKIAPLAKVWTWYQFSPYIQRQIYLITSQLKNLQEIYSATSSQEMLKAINKYLYFKKLLEWKSE